MKTLTSHLTLLLTDFARIDCHKLYFYSYKLITCPPGFVTLPEDPDAFCLFPVSPLLRSLVQGIQWD